MIKGEIKFLADEIEMVKRVKIYCPSCGYDFWEHWEAEDTTGICSCACCSQVIRIEVVDE